MSSYIESVLQRLLIPDSAIIKQATKQLLDYFVSEKCVFGLYEVLKTSKDKQVIKRTIQKKLQKKLLKNKTILYFSRIESTLPLC